MMTLDVPYVPQPDNRPAIMAEAGGAPRHLALILFTIYAGKHNTLQSIYSQRCAASARPLD